MTIKRDYYVNPYRDMTRMNGIRTGQQNYRDASETVDKITGWPLVRVWALAFVVGLCAMRGFAVFAVEIVDWMWGLK